jgi:hypothetical protein
VPSISDILAEDWMIVEEAAYLAVIFIAFPALGG